ncbi:MAG: transporter [Fluviicola sp.]|nr:MAG: transporter [Fluviicola sp.]
MHLSFYILLGLLLFINSVQAQQSSMDELLQTVEANNKSLKAHRSYMESENLQYNSENKLPDLQISAFYLPFGDHNTTDYSEFQVSQRIEFPTVYAARNNWMDGQSKRLEYEYQKLKQDILLEAKKLGLGLIFLNKQRELVQERILKSKKVYDQIQTLFEKGKSSILNLNKAKIIWLDQQFALEELDNREAAIRQKLKALNGGDELTFQLHSYPSTIGVTSTDSLWNTRLKEDPQIALLEQEKQVAQQRLKVERNQLLPDITVGYNYQGIAGSNYSGIYGGISIPLWSGRNKVKVARARINYNEHLQSAKIISLKNEYSSEVQRYELLLRKFNQYTASMDGLNSEELLQKSYELGEISFMTYYAEISFYRDAENRMLEIEKELQQLKADLFKYQL